MRGENFGAVSGALRPLRLASVHTAGPAAPGHQRPCCLQVLLPGAVGSRAGSVAGTERSLCQMSTPQPRLPSSSLQRGSHSGPWRPQNSPTAESQERATLTPRPAVGPGQQARGRPPHLTSALAPLTTRQTVAETRGAQAPPWSPCGSWQQLRTTTQRNPVPLMGLWVLAKRCPRPWVTPVLAGLTACVGAQVLPGLLALVNWRFGIKLPGVYPGGGGLGTPKAECPWGLSTFSQGWPLRGA